MDAVRPAERRLHRQERRDLRDGRSVEPDHNPGFKNGTASERQGRQGHGFFDSQCEIATPEGVGVDNAAMSMAAGRKMAVRRWTKS